MTTSWVYLLETKPFDPATSATKNVFFASNVEDEASLGQADPYMLRLKQAYTHETSVFQDNLPGGTTVSVGSSTLNNADGRLDYLMDYLWDGRAVVVKRGLRGQPYSSFQTEFSGSALELTAATGELVLTIRDNSYKLAKVLQANKYLGSGGKEGGVDLKDTRKPLCYGPVRNLAPVAVDDVRQIYQIHDGPIQAVTKVYDRAVPLQFYGDYASYATLQSIGVSPGYYATCLAEGFIKLGAPTAGTLTCDANGQYSSSTTIAALAKSILMGKMGLTLEDLYEGSFDQLALDAPYAYEGIYLLNADSQADEILETLVSSIDAFWFLDKSGRLNVRKFKFGTPVASVRGEDVIGLQRQSSPYPLYKVVTNYSKNPTVLGTDEFTLPRELLNGYLKDNKIFVATATDGTGGSYTYQGEFLVFLNTTQINDLSAVNFAKKTTADWLTLTPDGKFTVTDPGADTATVTLVANLGEYFLEQEFTLTKSKGASPKNMTISTDRRRFFYKSDGTPDPAVQTATVSVVRTNLPAGLTFAAVDNLGNAVTLTGSGTNRTFTLLNLVDSPMVRWVDVTATASDGTAQTVRILVTHGEDGVAAGTLIAIREAQNALELIESGGSADTTPPGQVTGLALSNALQIQADGSYQALLKISWSANTESDLDGYDVYVKSGSEAYSSVRVDKTATFYLYPAVSAITYKAKVRAVDKAGNLGAFSTELTMVMGSDITPPGLVTGLTVEPGFQTFHISWTNPADADLASVEIWESATSSLGAATMVGTMLANPSSQGGYARSGLPTGATRYYWARTVDSSGNKSGYGTAVGPKTLLLIDDIDFTPGLTAIKSYATLPNPVGYIGNPLVFNTTDRKLYRYDPTVPRWTVEVPTSDLAGTISTAQIAANAISLSKFASDIKPIEIVSALPTSGNVAGRVVFLNTDNKLYRFNGTSWTASVPTVDLVGTVSEAQIADLAISAAKVAESAITTTKLANDAVTAGKIAAAAIGTTQLADGVISSVKLANGLAAVESVSALPSSGNFRGRTVMLQSDGKLYRWNSTTTTGTASWTASVPTVDLVGTVSEAQIADLAISAAKVADNAISVNKIVDGAIAASKIATSAVTSTKIADAAISNAKLANGLAAIESVSALPNSGNFQGRTVMLQSDGKLYRWNSTTTTGTASWSAAVPAVDLTGTVSSAQIADLAISATKIADNAVTVAKIVDGAVAEAKIASNAITASKIVDGVISNLKLANGLAAIESVSALPNSGNFQGRTVMLQSDGKLYRWNSTAATGTVSWTAAVPTVDLTGTVSSAQIADLAINSDKIAANAVTVAKIVDGAIAEAKLASSAVTSAKIADAAISNSKLIAGLAAIESVATLPNSGNFQGRTVMLQSDGKLYRWNSTAATGTASWSAAVPTVDLTGTVVATQIADGAVITSKIGDGAISALKLANASVNSDKLVDNAVITAKIAANAVTVSELADNAVIAAKISDGALTTAKFASTIKPIEIVSTLPTSGNVAGRTVFLTTDNKMYRYTGSAWISTVAAADVNGQLTVAQIQDGAITTVKLSDTAVTAAKVADGIISNAKLANGLSGIESVATLPSSGNFQGRTVMLQSDGKLYRWNSTAATGTASWSAAVPTVDLTGTIASGQIADGAILTAKLADNAVNVSKIVDGAIAEAKLATGAVTSTKIADAVISNAKLIDGLAAIESVAALPSSGNYRGRTVMLQSDGKLYRWNSTTTTGTASWTAAVPTVDLTGTIVETQIADNAVTVAKIVDGAISDVKIATGAVTTAKINDGALTAVKFAATAKPVEVLGALPSSGNVAGRTVFLTTDNKLYRYTGSAWTAAVAAVDLTGTVSAGQIADNAITVAKIADGAVQAGKIAANAVTGTELADAVLTAAKFASSVKPVEIVSSLPSSGNTAGRTVFLTTDSKMYRYTGSAWTAAVATVDLTGTIASGQLADGAVLSAKLADNAVTVAKIVDGAISDVKIATGAITTTKINDGALTAAKFASSVKPVEIVSTLPTSGNVAGRTVFLTTDNKLYRYTGSAWTASVPAVDVTGQITGTQITDNAITTAKIAANAVTATEIASNTITANQIAAGAITAGVIAANAITASKLFVGDAANFCQDPMFSDSAYWTGYVPNTTDTTPLAAMAVSAAYKSPTGNGTTSQADNSVTMPSSQNFTIEGGAKYRVNFAWYVLSGFTGMVGLRVYWYKADGTSSSQSTSSVYSTDYRTTASTANLASSSSTILTAPTDALYARLQVRTFWSTTLNNASAAYLAYPIMNRAASGELIVDGAITADKLSANSVVAGKIAAGTIKAADIASNTITATQIAAGTLTATEIASNAITAIKIAANAVTAAKIQAGTITANEIAANTLTANEIAANTITAAQIAAGTITASEIAAGTITASKLVIGDTSNAFPDSDMMDATLYSGTGWSFTTVASDGGPSKRQVQSPLQTSESILLGPAFPVEEGKTYLVGAWAEVAGAGTDNANLDFVTYSTTDGTGTALSSPTIGSRGSTTPAMVSTQVTIPAGARSARIRFKKGAGDGGRRAVFSAPVVRRAADGQLIVDGAITAAKILAGTITSNEIAANTITATQIAAGTLTAAEIAAGAITATQIATGAITAIKIAANTITATQIAAGTITATELAADSVIAGKIQAGAITTDKIAANSVTASKLVVADVTNYVQDPAFSDTAYWALTNGTFNTDSAALTYMSVNKAFRTLVGNGTTSQADARLQTLSAQKATIEGGVNYRFSYTWYVTNGFTGVIQGVIYWFKADGSAASTSTNTLTATDFRSSPASGAQGGTKTQIFVAPADAMFARVDLKAVWAGGINNAGYGYSAYPILQRAAGGELIVDGAITAAKVAADAITADKILAGSISAIKIASSAITADKIAADAVTATKILAGSITTAKLAANAVTANEIAAGTITATELASDSITAAKIAANAVTTVKLAAQSVTASKLVVADVTNYVQDPTFSDESYWSMSSALVYTTTDTTALTAMAAAKAVKIVATGVASQPVTAINMGTSQKAAIEGGAVFRTSFSWYVTSGYNGAIYNRVYWYKANGTTAASTASTIVPGYPDFRTTAASGAQTGSFSGLVTAPADAVWAMLRVDFGWPTANSVGTGYAAYPIMQRAANGQLIVDGAITADKLSANSVVAGKIAAGTIQAADIAANTITAAKIAANTITASEIAVGTITANEIASNAITTVKLAANAVTAAQIAANTITASEIAANTITAAKIAAGTITASEIATGAIVASKIAITDTSNMVADPMMLDSGSWTGVAFTLTQFTGTNVSTNYLRIAASAAAPQQVRSAPIPVETGKPYYTSARVFTSSTNTATATASVEWYSNLAATTLISTDVLGSSASSGGPNVSATLTAPANAVRAVFLWARSAGTSNTGEARFANAIMRRAANGELIVDGAISAAKIEAGAVSTDKLTANAVTAAKIAARTITAAEIATGAITANELSAGSIIAGKIAAGAVGATEIAANSITAKQLLISDYSNLFLNPNFAGGATDGWNGVTDTVLRSSTSWLSDMPSEYLGRMISSSTSPTANTDVFSVIAGETYYYEMWATGPLATSGLTVTAYARRYDASNPGGSPQTMGTATMLDKVAVKLSGTYTVPAGTDKLAVGMRLNNTTGGSVTILFSGFMFRRAASGELIVDGAITAGKIAANAITAAKIAAGTITATEIASGAITTIKLAAGAVTANEIASNAVTAAKIQAGTITANEIAAGAITATKLTVTDITNLVQDPNFADTAYWTLAGSGAAFNTADSAPLLALGSTKAIKYTASGATSQAEAYYAMATTQRAPAEPSTAYRISYAWYATSGYNGALVATVYFYKADGTAISNQNLGGWPDYRTTAASAIVNGSVTGIITTPAETASIQLRLRGLWRSGAASAGLGYIGYPIIQRAMSSELIVDGAVQTVKLAANAVTAAKIAAGTITASEIAAGTITATQISAGTITGNEIAANAITAAKIAAGTITASEIAANAIVASKLYIGDTSNIFGDPLMVDTNYFPTNAGYTFVATNFTYASVNRLQSPLSTTQADVYSATFPVEPGKPYYASCVGFVETGSTTAQFYVNWFTGVNGTGSSAGSPLIGSTTLTDSTTRIAGQAVAPATARSARFGWRKLASASNARVSFAEPVMRRASNGELIVDGAITADKVAANAITAGKIAAGTIVANDISAGAITTAKIATNAVTANEIAAGTITATEIASNAITAVKIAANAITAAKIQAGTITGTEIAANAITAAKIAAGTITAAEIAVGTIVASRVAIGDTSNMIPDPNMVDLDSWNSNTVLTTTVASGPYVSKNYLQGASSASNIDFGSSLMNVEPSKPYFVSAQVRATAAGTTYIYVNWYSDNNFSAYISSTLVLTNTSGSGWAKGSGVFTSPSNARAASIRFTKNSGTIGVHAVDPIFRRAANGELIVDGAISADKIAANAITAGKIAAGTIVAADIAANTITGAKIAADTITATNILAGTITATEIASNAITAVKIASNAITAVKIAANTITAAQLAANTITAAQIAAGTLTANELAANSITAKQLVLTDFSNIVDNGWQRGSIDGWTVQNQQGFYADNTATGWVYASNGRDQALSNYISVTPGESYYLEAWVNNTDTTYDANLMAYTYSDTAGTAAIAATPVATTSAKNSVVKLSGTFTVPAGVVTMRMLLQVAKPSAGGNNAFWLKPVMRRSASAELIVDGAVTAVKVAANAITAGKIAAGTIVANDIAANTITGSKIAADTITATNIAAGTITATEIASNAITAVKIASNAITAVKIAANTITAAQLAANTITAAQIAAGTITASEIAVGTIVASRMAIGDTSNMIPDPNMVDINSWNGTAVTSVGAGGAFVSRNYLRAASSSGSIDFGTSIINVEPSKPYYVSGQVRGTAAGTTAMYVNWYSDLGMAAFISSDQILSNPNGAAFARASTIVTAPSNARAASVRYVKSSGTIGVDGIDPIFRRASSGELIVDGAITADKIAANAITAGKIAAGTIQAVDIAAGTITGTQIAGTTITAAKIATGTITATQLASNSVTAIKIAGNTITGDKIAANTISGDRIAANTITAGQIAANTITAGQISAGTITGNEIAANAITAKQLVLVDFSNIADNGFSKGILDGWQLQGYIGFGQDTGSGDAAGWRVESNGRDQAASSLIAVSPGEAYYLDVWVYNTDSSRANLYTFGYADLNMTGPVLSIVSYTDVKNAWTRIRGTYTIPSGVRALRMVLQTERTSGTGSSTFWAKPVMRRAANAEMIVDGSITAVKIVANTITSTQIASGTITANEIATGTITASQIAANAITATQLAANSVTTAKMTAGSINADRLSAGTITATQLASNAVTTVKLAASAVTADKISVTSLSALTATIGTLRTAASGARMEIRDNVIKVYDSAGTLRVQLGDLAL